MKNQFFFAMVPVVALLAGCPTGPGDVAEGEGEGEVGEGEGEGEGENILASIRLDFPTMPQEIVQSDGVNEISANCIPVESEPLSCTVEVTAAGEYSFNPLLDQHLFTGPKSVQVNASGDYGLDWLEEAQCGVYVSGFCVGLVSGDYPDVQTIVEAGKVQMTGLPGGNAPLTGSHFAGTSACGNCRYSIGDILSATEDGFQIHLEVYNPDGTLSATDELECN